MPQLTDSLQTTTEPLFKADWARQRRTANDILQRLQTQEGVVLADQVGMGKTYVALAVAASYILSTKELEQVVIFVPPAVADKWVREWRKFSESLLEPDVGIRCVGHPIRSGEEFLRNLDDDLGSRKHIIVVTYGALTTTLKDTFIQLALIYYATRYIHNGAELRKRVAKWFNKRHGLIGNPDFNPERVIKLLNAPPSKWRGIWNTLIANHPRKKLDDDPVPLTVREAVSHLKLDKLRDALGSLPIRKSSKFPPLLDGRLAKAREHLADATQAAWSSMLSSIDVNLPLLIVDEAHRLKNPSTRVAKLFTEGSGAFNDVFHRMLFLTATPFELGHSELIEVLSRMGAVRPLDPPPQIPLKGRLCHLKKALTEAQTSALNLDKAWGRLTPADFSVFDAWKPDAQPLYGISGDAREAWKHAQWACQTRETMHRALQPWIIRHERPHRRDYYPGAAITENKNSTPSVGGLQIPDSAALPFLLAARTQSVAFNSKMAHSPFFAYGIASSFDACFGLDSESGIEARDSDSAEEDFENDDGQAASERVMLPAVNWYQTQIRKTLGNPAVRNVHPKVQATVEKAAQLWCRGEKCLIFCWFIKTGKVVEHALAARIKGLILERASACLGGCSDEDTQKKLNNLREKFSDSDSLSYKQFREQFRDCIAASFSKRVGQCDDILELVVDAAMRNLRTGAYLVRYTQLRKNMTYGDVWKGINGANPAKIAVIDRWQQFAKRLMTVRRQIATVNQNDSHDSEFDRIKAALFGSIEPKSAVERGANLDPVRRAYGGTERGSRERLIALFNTPFLPDLLVASSVMGEGVDLHQECRHVIHHDLDWNPSVLEQRTGRLDRIGALAERVGKNIEVYEPYLAGTHDEKMFRVVKDRAQWFDIVMGRPTGSNEHDTDIEEERQPLHPTIAQALKMDLRSS